MLSLWLSLALPMNFFEERAFSWISGAAEKATATVESSPQAAMVQRKILLMDALCADLLFDPRTEMKSRPQIDKPSRLQFTGSFMLAIFKWHYCRCHNAKKIDSM
jgi:hypothetical protein